MVWLEHRPPLGLGHLCCTLMHLSSLQANNQGFELYQHEMQIANFLFVGWI